MAESVAFLFFLRCFQMLAFPRQNISEKGETIANLPTNIGKKYGRFFSFFFFLTNVNFGIIQILMMQAFQAKWVKFDKAIWGYLENKSALYVIFKITDFLKK